MKPVNYIKFIDASIKKNELTLIKGGYMEEFENQAAFIFGNRFGISTCNGTAALYLALFCVSLENNKKEVIVPAYGFHGMISVICAFGLSPIFCDVDLKTFALDMDKCEKLINNKTLAVLVLQPWGNLADLDKITELKKKHNTFFISDSSHAHEAMWDGKAIGEFFDINCASFGMGKLISGGELGILTTNNPVFRDRALLFSHTNRAPSDLITNLYQNINNAVGIKFRPHLFAVLLALHDLQNNKNQRLTIKTNIFDFQREVSSITNKITFQDSYKKASRVFWKQIISFEDNIDIEKLIEQLKNQKFYVEKHNYKKVLSKNTILTNFYNRKVKENFVNSELITKKNILHIHFREFVQIERVSKLKKILFNYIHVSST